MGLTWPLSYGDMIKFGVGGILVGSAEEPLV